jgi:hypothetical protein
VLHTPSVGKYVIASPAGLTFRTLGTAKQAVAQQAATDGPAVTAATSLSAVTAGGLHANLAGTEGDAEEPAGPPDVHCTASAPPHLLAPAMPPPTVSAVARPRAKAVPAARRPAWEWLAPPPHSRPRLGVDYQPAIPLPSVGAPPTRPPLCHCGRAAVWDQERWWCADREVCGDGSGEGEASAGAEEATDWRGGSRERQGRSCEAGNRGCERSQGRSSPPSRSPASPWTDPPLPSPKPGWPPQVRRHSHPQRPRRSGWCERSRRGADRQLRDAGGGAWVAGRAVPRIIRKASAGVPRQRGRPHTPHAAPNTNVRHYPQGPNTRLVARPDVLFRSSKSRGELSGLKIVVPLVATRPVAAGEELFLDWCADVSTNLSLDGAEDLEEQSVGTG